MIYFMMMEIAMFYYLEMDEYRETSEILEETVPASSSSSSWVSEPCHPHHPASQNVANFYFYTKSKQPNCWTMLGSFGYKCDQINMPLLDFWDVLHNRQSEPYNYYNWYFIDEVIFHKLRCHDTLCTFWLVLAVTCRNLSFVAK